MIELPTNSRIDRASATVANLAASLGWMSLIVTAGLVWLIHSTPWTAVIAWPLVAILIVVGTALLVTASVVRRRARAGAALASSV